MDAMSSRIEPGSVFLEKPGKRPKRFGYVRIADILRDASCASRLLPQIVALFAHV
jgi:hypothetical protein